MKPNKKSVQAGRGKFIRNAAILTGTSLVLRGAGMLLKIYMSAKLGAQGVGVYQLIMSVYMLGAGFASSGIVVAVTRLTADELVKGTAASVRAVLKRCITFSLAVGMLSAVIIGLLSEPIGNGWLSDPRSVMSVRVLALILPIIAISCCVRGYFVARKKVWINSVGQLSEQTVRIVLTIILLGRMLPMGLEYGCLAIVIADLISEIVCTAIVSIAYLIDNKSIKDSSISNPIAENEINRVIWNIAAPVTASHYLTSLLRTVESVLVPDCLTVFEHSRDRALSLFGMVKGMALPLLLFPSSVLMAFSSLLVPEVSQAAAVGNTVRIREAAAKTLRLTLSIAMPVGAVFYLFPRELGVLIYKQPELEGVIRVLAPLTPLMYTESVSVGLLHGLGEQKASLIYGLIDSVMRIVLIALLAPKMGLTGFLLVMVVSNLLTPTLNIRRLVKVSGVRFDALRWLIEPLLCGVLSVVAVRLIQHYVLPTGLGDIPQMLLGGSAAAIVYALSLSMMQEDILPAARRLMVRGNGTAA